MPEPLTLAALSGLASAVSASVTGIKFVFDLKNTQVDVETCLDLIRRVNKDLQYLISLRTAHAKTLESTPEVLARVDGVIQDACESIQSVGLLLEGCRREAHGGQTPFKGRLKWVLADSAAFQRRTGNLLVQHAAINVEITNMRNIEALQPLKNLASEISFENFGMIPMGSRMSSSKQPDDNQPEDLGSPPSYSPPTYSPPITPSLSYITSCSQSLNQSPYTPEPLMSPNSYFCSEAGRANHNSFNAADPSYPNNLRRNQTPRIQMQEYYTRAENQPEYDDDDDDAAAFYREMKVQSEEKKWLGGH